MGQARQGNILGVIGFIPMKLLAPTRLLAVASLLLVSWSSGVSAQQAKPARPQLTPQQQTQLFPEQKALWLKHQRARISAIQAAERCVNAARTADAFKICIRQERQAGMELRRSHMAEMRALYGRYGIQLPAEVDRGGKQGGWKKGPGGQAPRGPAGAEL